MSTRVYRTLLWLYPKSFRLAYGEDMVAVFEEMRRDRSPLALWWRVAIDASISITVQRLETVMANKNSLVPVALAATSALILVTVTARGLDNVVVFFLTVLLAGGLAVASLVYWYSKRPYVEPSERVDRYWLRFLGAGLGVIALVNIGTGVDLEIPWLILFTTIMFGILMVSMGVILGLWHGVQRLRAS